jgi:hypothetical protein
MKVLCVDHENENEDGEKGRKKSNCDFFSKKFSEKSFRLLLLVTR